MKFKDAVEATPDIARCYRPGLQALKESERKRIRCKDSRNLSGTVDIDTCLKKVYPESPRWDYSIGIRINDKNDRVVWIEVHNSNADKAVDEVVRKKEWLLEWLESKAPDLDAMPSVFVWLASGAHKYKTGTQSRKKLVLAGIDYRGGDFRIDEGALI